MLGKRDRLWLLTLLCALVASSIAAPPALADLTPPLPTFVTPFQPVSFVFIAVLAVSLIVLSRTWSASRKSGSWTSGAKVKAIIAGVMAGLAGLILVPSTIWLVLNPRTTDEQRTAQITQIKKAMEEEEAAARTKAPIFYCIRDLPKGVTVKAEDLEEKSIRSDRVPLRAVSKYENVVGRKTSMDIVQGMVLMDEHFEHIAQKAAPTAKSSGVPDKASTQTTATIPTKGESKDK